MKRRELISYLKSVVLAAVIVMTIQCGANCQLISEDQKQTPPDVPRFTSGVDDNTYARLQDMFRPTAEAQHLAIELFEKGDLVGAEAACKKALALAPKMRDGRPFAGSAYCTLGEIRLAQKRNREALKYFLLCEPNFSERLKLSITLAYCRVGDYQGALRAYEYAMKNGAREEWLTDNNPDRPGAGTVRQIEASILLARAERLGGFRADHGEADLRAAEKLSSRNPMIAHELGKVLRDNEKFSEATVRLKFAARYGHGELAKEAKRNAEGIDAWNKREKEQKQITKAEVTGVEK